VEINYFIDPTELEKFGAVIVGTPTYHHDIPMDIKQLFEEAATKNVNLKGKIGATFGSYGWSGEAPKLVQEIMKNKFEMQIIELPLLSKYTPDQILLNSCKELGRKVSESLMH
jgi:flavorubredoxin